MHFLLKDLFPFTCRWNKRFGRDQVNDNIWHWQLLAQDQPNRYPTHFHFPKLLIERMHHHLRAIVPKFFASLINKNELNFVSHVWGALLLNWNSGTLKRGKNLLIQNWLQFSVISVIQKKFQVLHKLQPIWKVLSFYYRKKNLCEQGLFWL